MWTQISQYIRSRSFIQGPTFLLRWEKEKEHRVVGGKHSSAMCLCVCVCEREKYTPTLGSTY